MAPIIHHIWCVGPTSYQIGAYVWAFSGERDYKVAAHCQLCFQSSGGKIYLSIGVQCAIFVSKDVRNQVGHTCRRVCLNTSLAVGVPEILRSSSGEL